MVSFDYTAETFTPKGSRRTTGARADAEPESVKRFPLTPFDDIKPSTTANYLVKGLLPRRGLAVFWGAPKSYKSFFVFDLMMHVALDWQFCGRRVKHGPVVYCCLEGADGFRARVEAFRRSKLADYCGPSPQFHLMAAPLKLVKDHKALIEAIRLQLGEGVSPVAVVVDTLNRSMEGSESDDEAMTAYVGAADALTDAFDCLSVIVHHCGHNGDRPRGHSSLLGAHHALFAVKKPAELQMVVEFQEAKDLRTGATFNCRLEEVEVYVDDDGDSVTSLVVHYDTEGAAQPETQAADKKERSIPRGLRLLFDSINLALLAQGKDFQPYADGPTVKGVSDEVVRQIYYDRVAEDAMPDEEPEKLEARRQKAFGRAVKSALDAQSLAAIKRGNKRILWLPS